MSSDKSGDFAVCEIGGQLIEIALEMIPRRAKEGDVLVPNDNGTFDIDREATEKRRNKIKDLQNKLWE